MEFIFGDLWVLLITAPIMSLIYRETLFGTELAREFVRKVKNNTESVTRSGDYVFFKSKTGKTISIQFFSEQPSSGIYKIKIGEHDSGFDFGPRDFIARKLKDMFPPTGFIQALSEY